MGVWFGLNERNCLGLTLISFASIHVLVSSPLQYHKSVFISTWLKTVLFWNMYILLPVLDLLLWKQINLETLKLTVMKYGRSVEKYLCWWELAVVIERRYSLRMWADRLSHVSRLIHSLEHCLSRADLVWKSLSEPFFTLGSHNRYQGRKKEYNWNKHF